MRRRAILIGILAIAAALLYVRHTRASGPSDAARYRHYFLVGKRECHAMLVGMDPAPLPGITVWSGFTTVSIAPSPDVPAKYRGAITDGCAAASG